MGKYAQWITHKGRRILFVNVAGLREADYIAALEELKQALLGLWLASQGHPPLL